MIKATVRLRVRLAAPAQRCRLSRIHAGGQRVHAAYQRVHAGSPTSSWRRSTRSCSLLSTQDASSGTFTTHCTDAKAALCNMPCTMSSCITAGRFACCGGIGLSFTGYNYSCSLYYSWQLCVLLACIIPKTPCTAIIKFLPQPFGFVSTPPSFFAVFSWVAPAHHQWSPFC